MELVGLPPTSERRRSGAEGAGGTTSRHAIEQQVPDQGRPCERPLLLTVRVVDEPKRTSVCINISAELVESQTSRKWRLPWCSDGPEFRASSRVGDCRNERTEHVVWLVVRPIVPHRT